MAINDIYSLSIDSTVHNVVCTNVAHYKVVADGSGSDPAQALKDAWDETVKASWLACLQDDVRLFCMRIRQVTPASEPEKVFTLDVTYTGGQSPGESIAASSVMIISFYSELYTKRGRGRMFLSGCPEDSEKKGQVTAAQIVLNETLGTKVRDNITETTTSSTWQQVIYHADTELFDDIVRTESRSILGSHRSRTAKFCVAN